MSTPISTILEHALAYHRLGLSVVAAHPTQKKPAAKWGGKNNEPADEKELRYWFENAESPYRIGIVCGAVSRNLVVRDFDNMAAYERWARAYPNYAETLPTVETGRPGRHVYLRSTSSLKTQSFDDGEFRGDGAFVVCPPSKHANGMLYKWTRGSPEVIPDIDPEQAGLLADWTQGNTVSASHTVSTVSTVSTVLPESRDALEAAIRRTIPPNVGWREKCLFNFCRELQAIPAYASADPQSLEPIVRQWYERAEPHIGTKEFAVCLAAFCRAWGNVKVPKDQTAVQAAFSRIRHADHSWIPDRFDNQKLRLLIALCRELQSLTGQRAFYLDCRTTGDCLGVAHKVAWSLLRDLCELRVLEKVSSGSLRSRKANEYRFLLTMTG